MTTSDATAAFTASDDLFHPPQSRDPNIVETVWWNFHIPEANLDAEIYFNFRRNLGITYAGIYIWDDFCRHYTDMLYFDTRSYLPIPNADLDNIQLANGFSMRVVAPLKEYDLHYRGYGDAEFSLRFTALAQPIGFLSAPAGNDRESYAPGHFDQVGRMTGELRLEGRTFAVNCITQRDRSWNALRKEDPGHPPDVGWHSAHFGEDLWFQCWIWNEEPVATDLQGGVVYKRGKPVRIIAAERRTQRDVDGVEPRVVDLRLIDADGDRYELIGRVRNMFPWPGWFNMVGFAGLVEWELNGRKGWGEVHDGRTVSRTIARKRAARR